MVVFSSEQVRTNRDRTALVSIEQPDGSVCMRADRKSTAHRHVGRVLCPFFVLERLQRIVCSRFKAESQRFLFRDRPGPPSTDS
jgi:hypothetical protein